MTDPMLNALRLRARLRLAFLSTLQDTDPVHVALDDLDHPDAERSWRTKTPELQPWIVQLEASEEIPPRLARMARVLDLTPQETQTIALGLAATVDPTMRRLCGQLLGQGSPRWPTYDLVARLFDHGRTLTLSTSHATRAWDLLQPEEHGGFSIEPGLARWLCGEEVLTDLLVGAARIVEAKPALPRWPVDAVVTKLEGVQRAGGPGVVVRIEGPTGVGRRTFAALVCQELGMGLLAVDLSAVPTDQVPRVALHAQRQARLDGLAVAWVIPPPWSAFPAPVAVQFLLAGPAHHPHGPPDRPRIDVELPLPNPAERQALWRATAMGRDWSDGEIAGLAQRHRVTVGDVQRAAWQAPADPEGASMCVKVAMRGALGDLAQRLPCTFTWSDLVLPEALDGMLHDLAYEAQQRTAVWERPQFARLFPQGRALLALFTGPPGTGKTMAAQVMARELGLDLYRIDLSAMVSKYVGETSKNIERVLSAAERLDVVLFFDEADSLFGKRTDIKDAHDRFANADTNYLLQAIEAWPGVAILASNKRGNLDVAFVRRLRHILTFPSPDTGLRRRLWRQLMASLVEEDGADTHDHALCDRLSASVPLTGAQIKNALLTATVAASRDNTAVSSDHVLLGVQRELLKVGRGLSRAESARLVGHAPR